MNRGYTQAVPLGYQQIVAPAVATGLTIPAGAVFARVIPETQAVRFRDDGTAPTAAVGMPIAVGAYYDLDGNLAKYQFIQQAVSATLNVVYYGTPL